MPDGRVPADPSAKARDAVRSVTDHQALVASLITPPPSVDVDVSEALSRSLAENVTARAPLPGFDNSAMDGYAVRAEDVSAASAGSPVALPVAVDLPAGTTDVAPLEPGSAHRIMTGAPVPPGADAIVPVEATDGGTTTVRIHEATDVGRFVRRSGSDLAAGEPALTAGTTLGAPQLALLAALGETTVRITPPLHVLVVTTGDELVDPGDGPLRPGQIFDANGVMLAAAVRSAGARSVRNLVTDDDVPGFLYALDDALDDVDVVLTSGGVSAGAYEVVREALGPHGIDFAKVAMQPGMPQGAGRYRGVPVISLPGNPVSSLVSFEVFVRPALRAAMGLTPTERRRTRAMLTEPLTSIDGKRQLRRGVLDSSAATVTTSGPAASHHLHGLAHADALIDIPTAVTELAEGTEVEVWDLRD